MGIFRLLLAQLLLTAVYRVEARAVYAHFMVSNAVNYTSTTWQTDIGLAQDAHIDAFALNIAYGPDVTSVLDLAFAAAEAKGFQLFFSFDYAGGGPWPSSDVKTLASSYISSSAYATYNGQPIISTFEGPGNADDWTSLKSELGCFFIPDYSSLGADAAVQLGVADGLFNWAAWAWGDKAMDTYIDASYKYYLNGMPYMMPASPWFYTNLPGYDKNWLWRGDNAWYDRWVQIWWYQPEFVEIISWNDYGESHYIGPLYDDAMELFTFGDAPFNFATNMPHDGWRLILPFVIDMYKEGTATIKEEGVVGWYRLSEAAACNSGGTSGNTASQLQIEFEPYDIVEDAIFFTAILGSSAQISVSVGGVSLGASWSYTPEDGVGLYHGSASFSGHSGAVVITVTRNGATIASFTGQDIGTDNCVDGYTNFNAWVGSATGGTISATPSLTLDDMVCINGTGANNFAGLCSFACGYTAYCPPEACVCLQMGAPLNSAQIPSATHPVGYPVAGEDSSYSGLCAYDCELGYCPPTACTTTSAALTTPTVSDFENNFCHGGTGSGNLGGLCSFSCAYGFCPIAACTCTDEAPGLPAQPSSTSGFIGTPVSGVSEPTYSALCSYACAHGYCPDAACTT
ncbi:glycosyl hydrolase family 71-domain-containing protein, partial [Xylariales sp. PMI_506]